MIRNATVEDAEVIAKIHVQTWHEAYRGIVPAEYLADLSEEKRTVFWRQELSAGRSTTLVALSGREIVGWVSGGLSQDDGTEAGGEVYAIYVAPSFWRRGVGRELMKKIEETLPDPVVLWVLAENQSACQFYERLGYRRDGGEKKADFGSVSLSEIRLRKKAH